MTGNSDAGGRRPWEILLLLGIGALAGWLRLRDLALVEFKADEAIAVHLARHVLDGDLATVGLTSSIGARNPPLFVYLTAIPLAVRDDALAATAFVGVLAVAAVVLTYFVLRPRYGALVALGAAALFATAPWAVLYGRKLWGQSMLPVVAVALLWSMFAVLERPRSRAVVFVPILLCLAFQLNFSALALAVPSVLLLAYRARCVHWRALAAGVGVAAVLLAPWLSHQVTHGFADVSALVSGGDEVASSETGPVDAVRQSFRLVGVGDWMYVVADSMSSFVADAGPRWKVARGASIVAATLFALGLATCALCVARGAGRSRRWPWFELRPDGAARALLLVWLAGVWVTYATPATDVLFPHYLIVTFPVSFAVQALALADLVGALRSGFQRVATIGAIATLVVVSAAYTAFTLSFHRFLDDVGGTAGDYGVVYRDQADLAALVKARGLRVANEPVIDFLVTGDLDAPPGAPPLVSVRDSFHDAPLHCAGELRSFGVLSACLPAP